MSMRNGSRLPCLIVALALAMPLVSAPALADGFTVRYDTALDAWSALAERDQFSIINFEDGVEKMIISIQLDASETQTANSIAWLVPLPAPPEQVSLRLMSIVPRLNGTPIVSAAAHEITDDPMWLYTYGTQLYTLPITGFQFLTMGYGVSSGTSDIQTYGSVVGLGITSEVIGTNSSEALDYYMEAKGLTLSESAKPFIDEYVGMDYSLVLSWISDVSEFSRTAMKALVDGTLTYTAGVEAEFQTDDIFYPLKLTRAYGALELPITVQVLGHVAPMDYPSGHGLEISWGHYVEDEYEPVSEEYFMSGHGQYYQYSSSLNFSQIRDDFQYFFDEQVSPNRFYLRDVDYTTFRIEGPANELTSDLWLADSEPVSASAVEALGAAPWLLPVLTLVLASLLSGFLSGSLVFRGLPVSRPKLAALGILNLGTLLGVYLGYIFLVEKRGSPESREVYRRGCIRYVWCFSFAFLLIAACVHLSFYLLS